MTQAPAGNSRWKARGWIPCGRGGRNWEGIAGEETGLENAMTAGSAFQCRQPDWCLFPPTLVVSLSAFSQYEFDLADLAGGRQQDEGRGDSFSVIQKCWGTVGERGWPLERQCMPSLFPVSGELSKASGQPHLCSQSREGECCFIFKRRSPPPCTMPPPAVGFPFQEEQGKNNLNQTKRFCFYL